MSAAEAPARWSRVRLTDGLSLRTLPALEVLRAWREGKELAEDGLERPLCSNACLLARALEGEEGAVFPGGQAVLAALTAEEIASLAARWDRLRREGQEQAPEQEPEEAAFDLDRFLALKEGRDPGPGPEREALPVVQRVLLEQSAPYAGAGAGEPFVKEDPAPFAPGPFEGEGAVPFAPGPFEEGPAAPERTAGPEPFLTAGPRRRGAESAPRSALSGAGRGGLPADMAGAAGRTPGGVLDRTGQTGTAEDGVRWAEEADRVFRRDSRRYDGGFYLY